jgi:penicillin-binding protein 2
MAYAPVDKPQIAVALIVENGGWGATVAAPIARTVFDYWLDPERDRKTIQAEDEKGLEDHVPPGSAQQAAQPADLPPARRALAQQAGGSR